MIPEELLKRLNEIDWSKVSSGTIKMLIKQLDLYKFYLPNKKV